MLRKIYYLLPPALRLLARKIWFAPADLLQVLKPNKDDLVPPKGLIYTGGGDFLREGNRYCQHFIQLCHLKPDHAVLDIGCGVGRMAVPLTKYLNTNGKYEGFDPMKPGIDWCQKNISSRYPHFNFRWVQLENDLYNSRSNNAGSFHFPYPNHTFDFVILTSVFTHMLPEEVRQYLAEIKRVCKPEAKVFATFFLLTDLSTNHIHNSSFQFPYRFGHYALMDNQVKSANVAYDLTWLQNLLTETGFSVEKLLPGFWSDNNKEKGFEFQDVIILNSN